MKQGSPKNNAKQKPAKAAPLKAAAKKPAPAKAAPAKKPAPAAKVAVAKGGTIKGSSAKPAAKAAPAAAKKKPEPAKKPAAPAKAKKEEAKARPAAAAPAAKAAAPAKAPAAPKVAVVKAVKPPKPPKPPPVPKVPKVPKLPPAKGPMEKAQRSLAATAARAAAKDKVPPSKALSAVKDAVAKQQLKNLPADVKVAPKKVSKTFFHEVAAGAERIIKRGDKTTASPIPADIQNRRRGGGGEESPEELVERIERELEHQHIFKRNMLRPQLCTKCGINQVSERFTIDKELGYCDDCAEILHLGETKEARKIDFHPTLMKKEGEPAVEGEPKIVAEDEEEDDDDDDEDEKGPAKGKTPIID
ncbi:MAG: hypothetical protein ABI036_19860 [Fibrobacteria bacterium]